MSEHSRVARVLGLVVVMTVVMASCSSDDDKADGGTSTTVRGGGGAGTYEAEIRRTSYGIPHITANSFGSLGFGQGYAFAEDHLCTLADQVIKVRSERSKWFGPGEGDANLDSDFAYLSLGIRERAKADLEAQPAELVAIVEGYAAGYNAYLSKTGVDSLPGTCKGADWVTPITPLDLFTYYRDLALFASGQPVLPYIAAAEPPMAAIEPPPVTEASVRIAPLATSLASNGWAVGGDRTESGGGMVLANPHFPWYGEKRLWESHLTIPGQFNVYGASLLGAPGVLVGFNDHVAWTHTVSAGNRFTGYRLTLVPGKPTSYLYDGKERGMVRKDFVIEVRGDDGTTTETERTMWSSHYGPMLVVPGLEWTAEVAYTYRDANIDNDELLPQFLGMNTAKNLDEFQDVFRDVGGIPWVNTMVADDTGRAWFADGSATPYLSDEAIAGWKAALETDPIVGVAYDSGLVVLDGSDPVNEWIVDPDARDPGLLPFKLQPKLERNDYVFNANDPHWIANPAEPLEGFSPLVGAERERLSSRSRQNIAELEGSTKLTTDDLLEAVGSGTSMMATLWLADVVERCTGSDLGTPLGRACVVLSNWDGTFTLDSRGAALWREFRNALPAEAFGSGPESLWAVPFDPADPVNTPSGLAPSNCAVPQEDCEDLVKATLSQVTEAMEAAGIPLDSSMRDLQYSLKGDGRIPIPGGQARDGIMNVVDTSGSQQGSTLEEPLPDGDEVPGLTVSGLTTEGYRIVDGSSFIMAVEFGPDGPEAQGILTYSQSDDPEFGHDSDQTELFSKGAWRPMLFVDADIEADPELRTYTVSG